MGCRQCLPLSVVQLKGKHCQKPHYRNGVVDTFWPSKFNLRHFQPQKFQPHRGLGLKIWLKSLGLSLGLTSLGLKSPGLECPVTCQKVSDGKVKNKEVHPCHFAPKYRIELLRF